MKQKQICLQQLTLLCVEIEYWHIIYDKICNKVYNKFMRNKKYK